MTVSEFPAKTETVQPVVKLSHVDRAIADAQLKIESMVAMTHQQRAMLSLILGQMADDIEAGGPEAA